MLLGVFPPPLSRAEALRLLVGVPLPERESSVKSWREGSLYMATTPPHTHTHADRHTRQDKTRQESLIQLLPLVFVTWV